MWLKNYYNPFIYGMYQEFINQRKENDNNGEGLAFILIVAAHSLKEKKNLKS